MNRKVGIVAQDSYWMWINDAVRFPGGQHGIYARMFWKKPFTQKPGVAILPVLANGNLILIKNYRHAIRSFTYEIPRGGIAKGESVEQAVLRELQEETGYTAAKVDYLGSMHPDSGMIASEVPVFLVYIDEKKTAFPEISEAIACVQEFSLQQVLQGFAKGYLEKNSDSKAEKISLKDPFLSFALMQLYSRKKIEGQAFLKEKSW